MSFTSRTRLVNPRLGTYFSIFAALFVAIFLLSLIFEQLSVRDNLLRFAFFAGPILLYLAIGWSVRTNEAMEYFASGRRVPAVYTGMLLATIGCGGTLLVCGAGTFFIAGFDGLVLMMGGLAGFVFMAMLLAPFYRKFGAYTVPSYLGRRFDSRTLRLIAALTASVPVLLVLAAELRVGSLVAAKLTASDERLMTLALAGLVAVQIAPGGKRSFTWASTAQCVGMLLAFAIVSATIATLVTSLPVPQLTHGPLVRNLVRNEMAQGLQMISVPPLAFSLPHDGMQALVKPYTAPFGNVGTIAFPMSVIMIAAGIASAPWLLPRVAATPSVYEARKSLGWATVLFGFIMLTVSSFAVFMRDAILDLVMNERVGALPEWLEELTRLGFVALDRGVREAGQFSFSSFNFDRDSVLFAAGVATELPRSFLYLAYAGALAASLATISATSMALAGILSEDIVQGLAWDPPGGTRRVWIARAALGVAALSGSALTLLAPADPLRMLMWALAISGASFFPVLVLSIWWKRLTRAGAIMGVMSGFGVAAAAIMLSEAGAFVMASDVAGFLGLPVAAIVALSVSSLRQDMSRHDLEVVRDIRVPGGEIIYDREMRRQQLRRQARS